MRPPVGVITAVPSVYPKQDGLVVVTFAGGTLGESLTVTAPKTGIGEHPVGVFEYVIL